MSEFMVFVRAGTNQWETLQMAPCSLLGDAKRDADQAIEGDDGFDRAVVMEVSGVDAVPSFTYRYGAKR